jgi:putative ABC transport system substrate-binding protein
MLCAGAIGKFKENAPRGEGGVRRRELLLLISGALTVPPGVRAQHKAMPLIGYLIGYSRPPNRDDLDLIQGMNEAGYFEGQNVKTEYRWADDHYDRLPALAADLVDRGVDLIVTIGGTPAALAAKSATSTIPIIFTFVSDPIADGLVANLARPGGNLTGFTNIGTELMGKRLELLSELVPQVAAIGLLVNPTNPNAEGVIRYAQEAARAKGVQLSLLKTATEAEIDAAFACVVQLQVGGLLVAPDRFFLSRRAQFVRLASRHAVPTVFTHRPYVAGGGLISYGSDDAAVLRQAGIYAGKILNGAKPADLPVQQPTRFELVINLKTAKALGLTVPPSILARADEVIE